MTRKGTAEGTTKRNADAASATGGPQTPAEQPVRFCDHCGEPLGSGAHDRCVRLRAMEPPRFCAFCRRRMVVQVVPRGWVARCVEHGEIGSAPNG